LPAGGASYRTGGPKVGYQGTKAAGADSRYTGEN